MGVSWWVLDIGDVPVEPLVGRRDVCGLPPYGMRRDNIYHFCVAEGANRTQLNFRMPRRFHKAVIPDVKDECKR